MIPTEFGDFRENIRLRHSALALQIEDLAIASSEEQSSDVKSDALAEALFLRVFTSYEADLERLFLHYVTGGVSVSGASGNSYLNIADEMHAKKIIKAGWKFLNWAKPASVRETAGTYIQNGWPLADVTSARSVDLTDCEKIRNRIAHQSTESIIDFNAVQRNLFTTERPFSLSPGQLLRSRHRQKRQIHIQHFSSIMALTLDNIFDPPI